VYIWFLDLVCAMSKIKYLHVGSAAVFIGPLLKVIDAEFDRDEHLFILYDSLAGQSLREERNVIVYNGRSFKGICCYVLIFWYLFAARKVFLHGLFDVKMLLLLFLTPFWGGKVYWIAWGGDLYDRFYESGGVRGRLTKYLRARVIKRVKHIVTYMEGDYRRAVEWFGMNAQYHECLMYPSNTYKELGARKEINASLNVLLGNSADPLNRHFEIFDLIAGRLPSEYTIYAPLSYGEDKYKELVVEEGKRRFGDRFKVLDQFMGYQEYTNFLASMDVIIFNHPIQQAMGNTITALGLGKTVYLRKDVSQWELFQGLGIDILPVDDVDDLVVLECSLNKQKVKEYFSIENLINQLRLIYC